MSPSCQTSSTDGTAASTASSAARFAWMSESTATRTDRRVSRTVRSERTAPALGRITGISHVDRAVTRDDDQAVAVEPGDARFDDLWPSGAQRPERPVGGVELLDHGAPLPRDQHAAGAHQ